MLVILFFKQKTAYERRISDWSSDVCSSDLIAGGATVERAVNTGFATSDWLTFNLHQFDATNAKRVTDAINAAIPNSASMIDGASIAIRASGNGDERKIGRASCRDRVGQDG